MWLGSFNFFCRNLSHIAQKIEGNRIVCNRAWLYVLVIGTHLETEKSGSSSLKALFMHFIPWLFNAKGTKLGGHEALINL